MACLSASRPWTSRARLGGGDGWGRMAAARHPRARRTGKRRKRCSASGPTWERARGRVSCWHTWRSWSTWRRLSPWGAMWLCCPRTSCARSTRRRRARESSWSSAVATAPPRRTAASKRSHPPLQAGSCPLQTCALCVQAPPQRGRRGALRRRRGSGGGGGWRAPTQSWRAPSSLQRWRPPWRRPWSSSGWTPRAWSCARPRARRSAECAPTWEVGSSPSRRPPRHRTRCGRPHPWPRASPARPASRTGTGTGTASSPPMTFSWPSASPSRRPRPRAPRLPPPRCAPPTSTGTWTAARTLGMRPSCSPRSATASASSWRQAGPTSNSAASPRGALATSSSPLPCATGVRSQRTRRARRCMPCSA
mmetsp:Transcript_12383/g.37075  ORF Transcript_12383/g.37075 Transcript_12383/m.37075 type:complete len:364 (-) Transcript_12383:547-1638(-)